MPSTETFKEYGVDFKATFSRLLVTRCLAIGTDAYCYSHLQGAVVNDLLTTKPSEQQWATMFQQASGGTQLYTYIPIAGPALMSSAMPWRARASIRKINMR